MKEGKKEYLQSLKDVLKVRESVRQGTVLLCPMRLRSVWGNKGRNIFNALMRLWKKWPQYPRSACGYAWACMYAVFNDYELALTL